MAQNLVTTTSSLQLTDSINYLSLYDSLPRIDELVANKLKGAGQDKAHNCYYGRYVEELFKQDLSKVN